MNTQVSEFIETATRWQSEMKQLRDILLDCGLQEEYKWKQPCYSFQGKNIAIIANFKSYCALSFLKGVFLQDVDNLLESPGKNSRTVRMMKFKPGKDNALDSKLIKAYIYEAIEVEKAGLKVAPPQASDQEIPEELNNKFENSEQFKLAFNSLTPGRQRAYLIFFNQAKQAQTRENRIKKYEDRILKGKGMNDCICGLSKRMPNCDGSHKSLER
ncbi:DUF1801 domain-containing protein [Parvicella tangerina]|uniref:YdhG-like domain-containing protein n=1 Tax=Parvicella tangerina TaxID=2829795 RepID=A0A916JLG6_9FLAO|nr:DUF1801 domain-containing protein [Parvicella tangerina]CAG5080410.1 hypothetical protein CRYO30217_01298 [Parvicella tangerina]